MSFISKWFGGGKPEGAPPGAPSPGAPAGKTCPRCERALLPGAPCPFCNPQHFGEELSEGTVQAAHRPTAFLQALGGVSVANEAAIKHGAKGFLYVFEGANKGVTVLLGGKFITIGRSPKENILPLNDAGASTRHCDVRPVHGGYLLVDLGSKNGTFVNDARVKERPLVNGDQIACGSTRIYVGIL